MIFLESKKPLSVKRGHGVIIGIKAQHSPPQTTTFILALK